VVELMHRLAKEQQCTILLVTHDNRILDIADRIINLEDGRLKPSAGPGTLALPNPAMYGGVNGGAIAYPPASIPLQALPSTAPIAGNPPERFQLLETSGITSPADGTWLPPATVPKVAKIYTIVCIDDSPTILYSLKAFLSDSLFSVVLIQDPIQALVQLVMANPDMVILDINMPKLDGYQLCTLLREHKTFKQIPVIAITGDPRSIDPVLLKKAGVTDYLTKPFDRSDLMIKLFPYLT
jgi:CheY-like chemotaxis protein